ncbi:hypothetical protein FPV20_27545 [Escherichia coli O177]|nr:hypothetical protein FPV20_27545 [Escherichia coli O177]
MCVFQLNYIYETRKPGIKEQIVEMVHNGVGFAIAPER